MGVNVFIPAHATSAARDSIVPISETIAAFTTRFSDADLTPALREFAKYHLLDTIGAALVAANTEFAKNAYAGIAQLSEGSSTSVIGMPVKFALRDAVLLNGILAHGREYDDTHMGGQVHSSASAVPCALGLSEFLDKSGRELMTAYLLGSEITARLGLAANNTLHTQGFHPSGIFGHYGCAIVASKLYELSIRETMCAQGLAGATSAALHEYYADGSWNKWVHAGWAGVGGITAASLARGGYVGVSKIYEGAEGVFRTHCGVHFDEVKLELITDGLGSVWHMLDAAIKPMPACHMLHASVDAALALRREHNLKPEDIAEAQVLLHPKEFRLLCEPVEMRRRPASENAAQTSAQFVIAAALERDSMSFAELDPEALKDERILALAQRVTYAVDPGSLYPKFLSGGITIKTRDGRTLTRMEPVNRGSGDRALSADDIIGKFMENAEMAVSRDQAERIRDSVLDCDHLSARAIARTYNEGGKIPQVINLAR